MDNDLKKLIGIVFVAALVLAVTKPKGLFKKSQSKNLSAPKQADNSDKAFEDSIIAIKAMRAAINENAPKDTLDELNRSILADYNLKVYQDKQGKLYTCNREGQKIANEA